jgi:ATP-dependent RNA helicase DeaD
MTQEQRDRVMKRVRAGATELLIATDVAARGLDIERLSHVINYDVPNAPEAYVHRIGRVGRAGREGVAITFVEPREHHLLRNIERITQQKIAMAKVPTVADLQARRMELTQASLREAILSDDKDGFRAVVEALSAEFDLFEIALGAVQLYHQATIGDAVEEPTSAPVEENVEPRVAEPGMTKIFIAAGREAGIRPQDLVGAISNEAGVTGKSIGAIQITDRFSLVEVADDSAERVIRALRNTKLRGKKVSVRRDKAN